MAEVRSQPVTRELPPPESLSSRQLRGVDCVFCGKDLSRGDVKNLGRQTRSVFGNRVSWFPRADPACLAERVS